MKQVLRFLRSCSLHNDKVWFDARNADFLAATSGRKGTGMRHYKDFSP